MTVSEIRDFALELNGVTEDIKWENHLCFSVAGKMFLVVNPDLVPSTAAFKVADNIFEDVVEKTGFSRHMYLGKYNWIHLDDIDRVAKNEWVQFITQSYQLVASKLPEKTKSKLNIIIPKTR